MLTGVGPVHLPRFFVSLKRARRICILPDQRSYSKVHVRAAGQGELQVCNSCFGDDRRRGWKPECSRDRDDGSTEV